MKWPELINFILLFAVGGYAGDNLLPVPVTAPKGLTRIQGQTSNQTKLDCSTTSNFSRHGIQTRGGAVIDDYYRWKDMFNVYIDDAYTDEQRAVINNAMYRLRQVIPCLYFGIWPRGSTPSGDYVHIVWGTNNGCNSYVGRQGGRQVMNLQHNGCLNHGTVLHEMLHALGFEHEHERPDRDDYINIYLQNVQPGQEYNFGKHSWTRVTDFSAPYNYKSIMHYDSYAFNKNGQRTMATKNWEDIPRGDGDLEWSDIYQLERMYGCTSSCPTLRWVNPDSTSLDYPIRTGMEWNGSDMYSCRAYHQGDIIPGKYNPASKTCYVGWGGWEYGKWGKDVEVLVNPNWSTGLTWWGGRHLVSQALKGGRTAAGDPLYVVKCYLELDGELRELPGLWYEGTAYVTWAGRQHACEDVYFLGC